LAFNQKTMLHEKGVYLPDLWFNHIYMLHNNAPSDYAFITQRINRGVGMVILLVETITIWGTTPVLKKELGCKPLLTYLTVVSALALTLGYLSSNVHAKTKSR
jgi:hypothetical protein